VILKWEKPLNFLGTSKKTNLFVTVACPPNMRSPSSSLVSRRSRKKPIQEVSAGGFVLKRTPRGVVFAMMKDSYGKWTFPKGHVESGEELAEAAARETMEELGLSELRLLEELGKIDIWFRDRFVKKGALIHKDIHYFLFEARPDAMLSAQPSEHVQDAAWVSARELTARSFYPDLVPVVKRALTYLRAPRMAA
jgi:8-oxo-dGTP pyrophosphatase MutT (NUDIX family)